MENPFDELEMPQYLARVLAPSVTEDEVWRLAGQLGWQWFRFYPELDEAEERAQQKLSFSFTSPSGEGIVYHRVFEGLPAFFSVTVEHAGLLDVVERHLEVWRPERILTEWEHSTHFDERAWLWQAAFQYMDDPGARDAIFRINRDCLYTLDEGLRELGARGVDCTGWPEWTVVAADAARWVMQERLRTEGDHGAL